MRTFAAEVHFWQIELWEISERCLVSVQSVQDSQLGAQRKKSLASLQAGALPGIAYCRCREHFVWALQGNWYDSKSPQKQPKLDELLATVAAASKNNNDRKRKAESALDDSSQLWPSKWLEAKEEKDKRQAPLTICSCCITKTTQRCCPHRFKQDECAKQLLHIFTDAAIIALQVHTWNGA